MKPKVVIAGLGETGTELVQRLCLDWDVIGIDSDPEAVERVSCRDVEGARTVTYAGDASSGLVLRRSGIQDVHAAVACCGSDEVNLEFLRILRAEFEVRNLYALMYSLEWEEQYSKEGIETISQDHACAAILESRVQRGQKVAQGVGLGEGEIIEVEVLPNSSVIGRTLAELGPRRWLIGAVYRGKSLIVPHGDTVLRPDDRVLLIGDPRILPSIATLIRTGESEFPLQYGVHIAGMYSEDIDDVLDEAAYLIENTRAELFEMIACQADEGRLMRLVEVCSNKGIPNEISCSAGNDMDSLLASMKTRDIGVLMLPPEPMSFSAKIGLKTTKTSRILDKATSPVLISRRTHPYRRILIALAEYPFHATAAQLAIDLGRMVSADLHLGVVHQPEIVAGTEMQGEIDQCKNEIENLAGMYHAKIETMTLEGNPIHQIVQQSEHFDLIVMPYRRGRTSFLTRPNVGLNIIHRSESSVLVMPY